LSPWALCGPASTRGSIGSASAWQPSAWAQASRSGRRSSSPRSSAGRRGSRLLASSTPRDARTSRARSGSCASRRGRQRRAGPSTWASSASSACPWLCSTCFPCSPWTGATSPSPWSRRYGEERSAERSTSGYRRWASLPSSSSSSSASPTTSTAWGAAKLCPPWQASGRSLLATSRSAGALPSSSSR
ncbi:MAG: hypothetical protein C4306_02140, partial [Thermoleophilia bacterium]